LILNEFKLRNFVYFCKTDVSAFGREIIFEEFQPMWLWARYRYLKYTSKTDRQTDAILYAILWQYRAVHSIAREKEIIISSI